MKLSTVTGSAVLLLALLAIAGCSTPAPKQTSAPPPPVGTVAPAVADDSWPTRLDDMARAIEDSTRGANVSVERTTDRRLRIVIPGDTSFAVGRSAVTLKLAPVLDQIADGLMRGQAPAVTVIGHTDNQGGTQLNQRLSLARANAVRNHLVAHGMVADHVKAEGRGETEPVADNGTAAGRAQNRRIEIFVSEAGA